jgi:hypothetical protein
VAAVTSNITYESGRGWRFEYDHVADDKADSLKIFLRDLRVVTRMTALANGLENGTCQLSTTSPSPTPCVYRYSPHSASW